MKHNLSLTLAALSLATLTACNTMPPEKSPLELARSEHQMARNNPQTIALAASELQDADAAMQRANQAAARNESAVTVDHLAYLTRQRVAIAEEAARQKAAEQRVTDASAERDRMQLDARTREADAAQQRTLQAQNQARETELRNRQLEEQIKALNAKATPRGFVITFGDVLFDTNRATLKSGSARNLDKLVNFLNQYPQRNVLIEGFTDSTGSEALNQKLSEQRSEAVRAALTNMGVNPGRIFTRGYGEAYPVAGNTTASGRQLNRRVEIVLSDDSGKIPPR